MEDSASILKQLKIIKWYVLFITISTLSVAASIVLVSYITADLAKSSVSSDSWEDESFRDKVTSLVDKGKLEDAIKLSNERIKSHPNDEDAYWYRGVSYYLQEKWQPAIDDFNKVEILNPSWKEQYVEPYRTAAEAKQKNR